MTGKHRQSEVTLRQSDRLMISSSRAHPPRMRLVGRVITDHWCHTASHHGSYTYLGVRGGIDLVTSDGVSPRVISVEGYVSSVSVCDDLIYTLVHHGSWSVRVYDSDYQLVGSWRHEKSNIYFNQLAVCKDSVLVPHRGSQTIIQYSLTGEVERRIPFIMLKNLFDSIWLCVMSSHRDTLIISNGNSVCCIDVSTGRCVWSTNSLVKPGAVCCDDAGRVYVAVRGQADAMWISVLNGDTGRTVPSYLPPHRLQ